MSNRKATAADRRLSDVAVHEKRESLPQYILVSPGVSTYFACELSAGNAALREGVAHYVVCHDPVNDFSQAVRLVQTLLKRGRE